MFLSCCRRFDPHRTQARNQLITSCTVEAYAHARPPPTSSSTHDNQFLQEHVLQLSARSNCKIALSVAVQVDVTCDGHTEISPCNSQSPATFSTSSYTIETAHLKLMPEVAKLSLKGLQLRVHATELLFVVHMLHLVRRNPPEILGTIACHSRPRTLKWPHHQQDHCARKAKLSEQPHMTRSR